MGIIGEKIEYIITQINTENNNEQFVEYNAYNGSFHFSMQLESASRFELKEQAIDLAKLQNQMAKLMGKRFTYRVVEEVTVRKEIYSETEVVVDTDTDGEV